MFRSWWDHQITSVPRKRYPRRLSEPFGSGPRKRTSATPTRHSGRHPGDDAAGAGWSMRPQRPKWPTLPHSFRIRPIPSSDAKRHRCMRSAVLKDSQYLATLTPRPARIAAAPNFCPPPGTGRQPTGAGGTGDEVIAPPERWGGCGGHRPKTTQRQPNPPSHRHSCRKSCTDAAAPSDAADGWPEGRVPLASTSRKRTGNPPDVAAKCPQKHLHAPPIGPLAGPGLSEDVTAVPKILASNSAQSCWPEGATNTKRKCVNAKISALSRTNVIV